MRYKFNLRVRGDDAVASTTGSVTNSAEKADSTERKRYEFNLRVRDTLNDAPVTTAPTVDDSVAQKTDTGSRTLPSLRDTLTQGSFQKRVAPSYSTPEEFEKHAAEMKTPTLGERVVNTLHGAAKQSASSYANAAGVAYQAGEEARKNTNAAFADEAMQQYEAAVKDFVAMTAANKENPGTWSESDLLAQRNLVETLGKRANAATGEFGELVEQAQKETPNLVYQLADEVANSGAQDIEYAKRGAGKVGQMLVDAGASATQSLADNALGLATGSGMLPFVARAFGGSAQEARQGGADFKGQVLYGGAEAAKEYITEKLFGIALPQQISKSGGAFDDIIEDGIRNVTNRLAKTTTGQKALGGVLTWLASGATEGLEEGIGALIENLYVNPPYRGWDPDARTTQEKFEDALYDMLVGGISGLVSVNSFVSYQTDGARGTQTQNTPTAAAENAQERTETARSETTLPTTEERAQATQEADAEDILHRAAEEMAEELGGGERVGLNDYATPENMERISRGLNDGTLAVDALDRIYRTNESEHIDRRSSADMGNRSVNAFQFDHPELHQYYREVAAELLDELNSSEKGGEIIRRTSREAGDDEYFRTSRVASARIAQLLDGEGISYAGIEKALNAIINNHGQENFAAAKRVELMLDDMLSNGYRSIYGETVAPNEGYIAAKQAIPGADTTEVTHEELPIWDMAEPEQTVSRETVARNIAQVRDAATALGVNGSRALSTVYNESNAGSYAPQDAVRDFYQVYNASYEGKKSSNTTAPEYLRMAAENAGERDARSATQAKYFGKNAKLVRDEAWKKARLTSKESYALDALAKVTGTEIRFADTVADGKANANYENGVITLALDAEDPVMVSVVHEVVHRIREIAPEAYQKLANFVLDNLSSKSAVLNQTVRETLYGTKDVDVLNEEIVADAFGQMLNDSKVMEQFATQHRSAAQQFMDALHDLIVKIKRALNGGEVRLSENQKAAFADLQGKVSEMEKLFTEALETTQRKADSKNAASEGGEGKFSIKMLDDGRYYVKSDRQILSGNDPKQWGKQLQDYINSEIRKGNDIVLPTTDGNLVRITERSAYKLSDNKTTNLKTHEKTKLSDEAYKLKEEAASHIDEIVLTGEFSRSQEDIGGYHENDIGEDGFNTYTAYFEDSNGEYYRISFVSALNGDQEAAYSIGNIQKRKKPTSGNGSSARESSALNGSKLSNETIAQSSSGVKPKYSLKNIDEMEQTLNDLNEEYRGLERRDAEFQAAPEYVALMDAIGDARATKKSLLDKPEALAKALDSYSAWQEKSGYSDVIHRMEELRGEMKTLRGKLGSAREQAAQEAKAAMRASYSDSMAKSYATKAARKFGTTSNFGLAGYLTVNGTLLDFSGRQGYRMRDHREITDVLDFLPTNHGYSDGMIEFMNLGNIRLQSYGIDISKAPNTAQRAMLRKFFLSKNGDVSVDFSDENGRSVGSLEYDRGTSADRILNDIDTYFQTGGIPDQSVVSQFHGKYSRSNREVLDEYVKQYGEITAGETPYRTISVPKRTGKDKYVSQTIRTVLEAKATPNVLIPKIEDMVADGKFSYERYTDKQAISDAEGKIRTQGWQKTLNQWKKSTKTEVSKENMAMGFALYNNAANSGDVETALGVLEDIVGKSRNAAQALQAVRLLKKQDPTAQLYGAQRSVENLQEELTSKYGKNAPELEINRTLAEKFLNAETDEAREKAMGEIYRDIGRQMPSRIIDKWNAWRYLSMLGNPRTHVRNIMGNAGFAPLVGVKNLVGTGLEATANAVSGGKVGRTKGVISGVALANAKNLDKPILIGTKEAKKLLDAAWSDYANIAERALGEGKYNEHAQARKEIEEGRKIFGTTGVAAWDNTVGAGIEKFRKFNGVALDTEDMWFSKPHYAAALAGYCKANGITAEQITKGEGLDAARNYAIREAQKATYRDTNAFSQMVSELGRYRGDNKAKKAGSVLLEGILPFRKTPANILVRGVEYSPIGLTKAIAYDSFQVKHGKMEASEMLDHLSTGLTGTGVLLLGAYMAAEGLFGVKLRGSGGGDEDEKDFDALRGHQDYSLELADGTSITLDWLAPEVLPLFIGANLYEQMQSERDGELAIGDVLEAISNVSDPLLEMSCLQSLNDLFDSAGYASSGDTSALSAVVASAATSYLTQAIPTVLGQIERTGEGIRMTTYTDKNNKALTGDMQYTIGKASAKFPGLEYNQIPYIDAWGRTEATGNLAQRAGNNFLNPAYVSTVESSAMEDELERLYNATGDAGVLPDRAGKTITANGEEKDLTADEYVKYATEKGQTAYKTISEIVQRADYKALNDEDKAKVIEDAYSLANAKAKMGVSSYQPSGGIEKGATLCKEYGISEAQYVMLYHAQAGVESLKDSDGETITYSKGLQIMEIVYQQSGLSDKQRAALFEAFNVPESIRHYNKALVSEKLKAMRKKAK